MDKAYDVLVIGLGAMGSAALYQLAKRGVRALGIDRYTPPHAQGSSHGETRITRRAVAEGPAYVPLVTRSGEIWDEIEDTTGDTLCIRCGGLVFGRRDEGTRARGVVDFLAETIRVAQQFNIPHEILDTAALRAMFPQLTILDGDEGYFEPSAGFLFPDRCISRQLELARALGAETLVDTKVIAIERDDGSLSILSDKGRIAAARVVLTVGAWVSELLPEPLPVNFEIYPASLDH